MYCPHCRCFIDTITVTDWVLDVVNMAGRIWNVLPSDVMSGKRQRNIVRVRHACMAVLYHTHEMTLAGIGDAMDRDHTSVLHAIRSANPDDVQKLTKAVTNR